MIACVQTPPSPQKKIGDSFFLEGRGRQAMNVILLMLITVVKVLLTDPVTKRCGRCRLTISCSDETKKGGGRGAESG